jgi:hypothetical protein
VLENAPRIEAARLAYAGRSALSRC